MTSAAVRAARDAAEVTVSPEQAPSLALTAFERSIRVEERAAANSQRIDSLTSAIDEVKDGLAATQESVNGLREHVDGAISDVKVELGRQGVRVALLVAGISLGVSTLAAGVVATVVYFLTH